ncbi:hypothetical protein [Streptomyces sp. NPDC052107]|uniref:hypothetical protein n=1 Tax=Streptomyces sp. NPDC052107 TaxID=3155632 RepID=UPI00342B2306
MTITKKRESISCCGIRLVDDAFHQLAVISAAPRTADRPPGMKAAPEREAHRARHDGEFGLGLGRHPEDDVRDHVTGAGEQAGQLRDLVQVAGVDLVPVGLHPVDGPALGGGEDLFRLVRVRAVSLEVGELPHGVRHVAVVVLVHVRKWMPMQSRTWSSEPGIV